MPTAESVRSLRALHGAQNDWLAAYDRLRTQGMAQPETTQLRADWHPGWWWGTTEQERANGQAQALPLGDLADPISQLAGLLSPRGLELFRTVQARPPVAMRPGRLLANERGNLGPPPRGPQGEPLPESVVRDEVGRLRRLYHGTRTRFEDFDLAQADPRALYGPGIYTTESAEIAAGYAGKPVDQVQILTMERSRAAWAARLRELEARPQTPEIARQLDNIRGTLEMIDEELALAARVAPHIRPVYQNLTNPLDLSRPIAPAEIERITGIPQSRAMDGEQFYSYLSTLFGQGSDKSRVNAALQRAGYDGITHIGGARTGSPAHRVFLAFSPDNVYPSFNVEPLLPPGSP